MGSEQTALMEDLISVTDYNHENTVLVDFYGEDVSHVVQASELVLTKREVADILLCMFYDSDCHHGADGHNRMMLVAKMAKALGVSLSKSMGIGIPEIWAGRTVLER